MPDYQCPTSDAVSYDKHCRVFAAQWPTGIIMAQALNTTGALHVVLCILFCCTIAFVIAATSVSNARPDTGVRIHPIAPEVADGISISPLLRRWQECSQGIYLDVGTNVAVQIRKLYDPHKFPVATVLPVFDEYFGQDRRKVCAVGFEPNSAHTEYVEKVNAHFENRSLPARLHRGCGVVAPGQSHILH